MIKFLRGFFKLGGATGNRMVAGSPADLNAKQASYFQDSSKRLVAIDVLYNRYKGTPHAQKIKIVYDKSLGIHTYLVNRSRLPELELFHVQHTDHFLNTFTVILDVHEQQPAHTQKTSTASEAFITAGKKVVAGFIWKDSEKMKEVRRQNREIIQRVLEGETHEKNKIPTLSVPEISINTYASISYLKEEFLDNFTTGEISYTSSTEEKQAFMAYVSTRFGLEEIAYNGNALVNIQPHHPSQTSPDMLPIIHWNGCPYALNLEDGRLFPVRTFRKRH